MKKGSLNFLGRKNKQSLFDTNIKVKELDNVELELDSSAIPESGTAKVKSRPTVKHYTSSSDIVQGFAVPTPKVPVLPPVNKPKINMAVNEDRLGNGSAISVPDLVEGEIFIPPPPSTAPPPPPSMFIPPPSDLDSLQHPPMPPPKPQSKQQSVVHPEDDKDVFTSLKPPSVPSPKLPSTTSSASSSSLPNDTSPKTTVPDFTEPPKFAPPQPPSNMRQAALKALKNPPPKPVRLSSIPSLDEPPQGPAQTPPVKNLTPSSFNPQNTAKIYSVPKTGISGKQVDHENRPKQILLLHDPGFTDPGPVQVSGNVPSVAPPTKPARKNSFGMQLDIKENLKSTPSGQATPSKTCEEMKVEPSSLSTEQGTNKPNPPAEELPKLQKVVTAPITTETSQIKQDVSAGQSLKFSPMLDRKLRNLKTGDAPGPREGPAASPFALLMAAKEREKHRSKSNEPSASIQHSQSNPNSFTVIPGSTSFTSQDQTPPKPTMSVVSHRVVPASTSSSSSYIAMDKQSGQQRILSPFSFVKEEDKKEEQCMPLLPPPPEFDDHDNVMDSPPSSPPPDPPLKKVLPPTLSPVLPVVPPTPSPVLPVVPPTPSPVLRVVPPTPSPVLPVLSPTPSPTVSVKMNTPPPAPPTVKPKLPSPPKVPPPVLDVKTKMPVETKPKSPPTQAPSSLSASQATLLSILQKKMLEMDNKMDNKMLVMKETESDDWGSPLSDEETKVTVGSKVTQKTPFVKSATPLVKTQGLDMKELESKMAMKAQGLSAPSKVLTSNGPQSKQASGITFTVRPGTKQPITVVSKGDSS
ncbi:proline-rich protein 36 [Esox lucius]|uniref:proline-rich protein 36 n=1 Tax=Esox lucius TaxID=8010 RepID=UPI001477375A|nr:proline-rich protein 36 [Esox lucius]